MKTTIFVLLLSTTISAQKMSQETYNGLLSRQYKYIQTYENLQPVFVVLPQRQDISSAGWDWPINSTYNQYYRRLFYYDWRYNEQDLRYNYGLLYDTPQSFRRVYARTQERKRIFSLESKQSKHGK